VLETLKNLEARTIRRSGCRRPDNSELVFTSPAGRPIYSDRLAKRFKAILRQVGLPVIRLYDLRHTAATLGLAAGVPPKVVAKQLGHASAAFTLDIYSHLLQHMQSEAAERVEALLYPSSALLYKVGYFGQMDMITAPFALSFTRSAQRVGCWGQQNAVV
jgi:integrase